jgi:hypothetical protein
LADALLAEGPAMSSAVAVTAISVFIVFTSFSCRPHARERHSKDDVPGMATESDESEPGVALFVLRKRCEDAGPNTPHSEERSASNKQPVACIAPERLRPPPIFSSVAA